MADNEQKPDNKPIISKDDVLTTQARRIVFDCLMQGFNAKEAAVKANLGIKYTQNMVDRSGMNILIRQEQAKIAERTGITVGFCQQKFIEIADRALAKGKEGVARACYADLCKTIGGFQADAPNPKSMQANKLSKEEAKALAAAADWFYRHKYLAAGPAEPIVDISVTEPNNGETGGKQGIDDVQGQAETEGST